MHLPALPDWANGMQRTVARLALLEALVQGFGDADHGKIGSGVDRTPEQVDAVARLQAGLITGSVPWQGGGERPRGGEGGRRARGESGGARPGRPRGAARGRGGVRRG